MKTVLGSGPLAIAVMQAVLESNPNEQITLVNTSAGIDRQLPEGVRVVAADVTDKNIMTNIARRSELIFSCTDIPYRDSAKFYPAIAFALAHAISQTAAKLVVADNLYSFDTLLNPDRDFHNRVAIVQGADIIGPGIRNGIFGIGFLDKLFKAKTTMFFGNINIAHSFTFLNDLARALVNVGAASDTFGETWQVPNAPAMSIDKWIHLFEVTADRRLKLLVLPKILARVAGALSLTKESYALGYRSDQPCPLHHSKYASRFGDHVTYPSSIVKQTVQWYKQEINKYENK